MATTTFQDYNQNTPIVASWLNDVNGAVYTSTGQRKTAVSSAAAWVRFSISGGVVTVSESYNILNVVRSSIGLYVVSYATVLSSATNCYAPSMDQSGFMFRQAETTGSVTIGTTNTANTFFDPNFVSVVIFGNN